MNRPPRPALPAGVWVLGFVSLLMDISSEMVHGLLPLFLVGTLGVSAAMLGLIEGLAEATAQIVKVFSGALSDYLGKRKGLAVLGYGLGAVVKPLFAVASGVGLILTARIVDRIGKGIRGAPRDALIADLSPPEMRGAAYGLRQTLDTIGAVLGPVLAIALMLAWNNDFRAVFWVAAIPAALAVLLLFVGINEPARASSTPRCNPLRRENLKQLSKDYWQIVSLGAVFTLARFSEAFLVLRAQELGFSLAWVPLVLVVMNLIYSASAYPLGRLSDSVNPKALLGGGMALLLLADLVLATQQHWGGLLVGVALWGLHMGATQGVFARLIADTAPAQLRGTAFGLFNLLTGLALLLASVLAGLLWQSFGAAATFFTGAGVCALTLLGLALKRTKAPAGPSAA